MVATYMWDVAECGLARWRRSVAPLKPWAKTMPASVKTAAKRRGLAQSLWEGACLQAVETGVIRITVNFASFEDFWRFVLVPVVSGLISPSPERRRSNGEELHVQVRKQLPIAADGSITYEAFANAIRGKVPVLSALKLPRYVE